MVSAPSAIERALYIGLAMLALCLAAERGQGVRVFNIDTDILILAILFGVAVGSLLYDIHKNNRIK